MNSQKSEQLPNDDHYIIIGDIHGCDSQLERLLEQDRSFRGRKVVFVGDYVDVGGAGKRVERG